MFEKYFIEYCNTEGKTKDINLFLEHCMLEQKYDIFSYYILHPEYSDLIEFYLFNKYLRLINIFVHIVNKYTVRNKKFLKYVLQYINLLNCDMIDLNDNIIFKLYEKTDAKNNNKFYKLFENEIKAHYIYYQENIVNYMLQYTLNQLDQNNFIINDKDTITYEQAIKTPEEFYLDFIVFFNNEIKDPSYHK